MPPKFQIRPMPDELGSYPAAWLRTEDAASLRRARHVSCQPKAFDGLDCGYDGYVVWVETAHTLMVEMDALSLDHATTLAEDACKHWGRVIAASVQTCDSEGRLGHTAVCLIEPADVRAGP